MKKIKIGNLELNSFVYIPPMAGVTDLAFRKMVRLFDKDSLIATEMISSKALMYNPEQHRMKLTSDEHPVGIQLFGHEAEVMVNAARIAEEQGADFIDINMGCPASKITKGKDGAALMREPELAVNIAKAVVDSVKVPVTVKMRLGWNECQKNSPELAKRLEQVGIKGFTVHRRTKEHAAAGQARPAHARQSAREKFRCGRPAVMIQHHSPRLRPIFRADRPVLQEESALSPFVIMNRGRV